MGLFGSKPARAISIQDCTTMMNAFMKKQGLNPGEQRLNDPDTTGWMLNLGSAVIYIILNHRQNYDTIRIIAPIIVLPKTNILPLYRRCLEVNMQLYNCALGVSDDQIIVVHERLLEGLDQVELESTVNYIAHVADELDDDLANEFGATRFTDTF